MAKDKKEKEKKDKKLSREHVLENEKEVLTNQLKRALADYQNLKKRVDEEKSELTFAANLTLIDSVLEIMGDLDLAIERYTENEADEAEWLSGIKMIYGKMTRLLENQDLNEIKVNMGDEFNSQFHEAIGTINVLEEKQDGVVMGVARKGYSLGEKVLRPARVVVGKFDGK